MFKYLACGMGTYYGVDIAQDALTVAQARVAAERTRWKRAHPEQKWPTWHFLHADLADHQTRWPIPDNSLDVVSMQMALQYFFADTQTLRHVANEIKRVSKVDARVCISTTRYAKVKAFAHANNKYARVVWDKGGQPEAYTFTTMDGAVNAREFAMDEATWIPLLEGVLGKKATVTPFLADQTTTEENECIGLYQNVLFFYTSNSPSL